MQWVVNVSPAFTLNLTASCRQSKITFRMILIMGARGSVVSLGTMLQTRRSRIRVPMKWIFFNLPNPSSRTKALGFTQPLAEMSTRNLPGGGGRRRSARKADNLAAICESSVGRKCGNLDVSQSYGPWRPVTGIALPFYLLPWFSS
jgi:hypothetical protein